MNEPTYICPNCKAICSSAGKPCASCGTYIQRVIETPEEVFSDGEKASDYHAFIGSNAARYMEIFRENKNRRVFLHTNWAAFFLPVYWLFYRKMVLHGIAFCLAQVLLVSCGMMIYYSINKTDAQRAAIVYAEEVDLSERSDSENIQAVRRYVYRLVGCMITIEIVFAFVFSLFADWLYREHVRRKIAYSNGGVSRWALLPAYFLVQVSSGIITLVGKTVINEFLFTGL